MKLGFALLSFAAAAEPASQDDCPNDYWEFTVGDYGNYCRPKDIAITCDYRQMEVTFKAEHLYGTVDEDLFGTNDASANLADPSCWTRSDNKGNYRLTFKLDKCGTTVEQKDGMIVFKNHVDGNPAAATTAGIVMTSSLGFDVTCSYGDAFDLTIDDLYINIDEIDTGSDEDDNGQVGTGDFSQYFTIRAYSEDDYTDEITISDRVNLGAEVYLEIKENKPIPNSVDFFLIDCTGYKDINNPATFAQYSHQFVDNMCYSNLVTATSTNPFKGGQEDEYLRMNFRSFTFQSNDNDSIDIQCRVQLCAVDINGNKLDANCADNRSCESSYMGACFAPECSPK